MEENFDIEYYNKDWNTPKALLRRFVSTLPLTNGVPPMEVPEGINVYYNSKDYLLTITVGDIHVVHFNYIPPMDESYPLWLRVLDWAHKLPMWKKSEIFDLCGRRTIDTWERDGVPAKVLEQWERRDDPKFLKRVGPSFRR